MIEAWILVVVVGTSTAFSPPVDGAGCQRMLQAVQAYRRNGFAGCVRVNVPKEKQG